MYNQTQLSNLTATNNVYTNVTICTLYWASQVALEVKNPPANAGDIKTCVQFLCREDPLEEEMATHSSILAWRTSWTEEPGGLQSLG